MRYKAVNFLNDSRLSFCMLRGACYLNENLGGTYDRPFSLKCIFVGESSKNSSCLKTGVSEATAQCNHNLKRLETAVRKSFSGSTIYSTLCI
jgi:transcription elongation factor Elf1